MKKPSEYEMEVNRMTHVERILVTVVIVILVFIFGMIRQETKERNAASSQTEQANRNAVEYLLGIPQGREKTK